MGPQLLGYVVFWLLGAGPLEAQVTQNPRYLITVTGKKLTVTCSQNMNHDYMSWYRQDPGLGLRQIDYSNNVDLVDKGDVPEGYSVSRKEKRNFPLIVESPGPHQTSLYLCASSLSTVLHGQLLSAQKRRAAARTRRLLLQETPLRPAGKTSSIIPQKLFPTPQPQGLCSAAALRNQGSILYLL
uniref:T cell receptor beta variable 27 n=1 Tax=Callithrix jacchus TaxID=9483 RepID=A0A5F4W9S6_CALJA